jgi:hypothetical protein
VGELYCLFSYVELMIYECPCNANRKGGLYWEEECSRTHKNLRRERRKTTRGGGRSRIGGRRSEDRSARSNDTEDNGIRRHYCRAPAAAIDPAANNMENVQLNQNQNDQNNWEIQMNNREQHYNLVGNLWKGYTTFMRPGRDPSMPMLTSSSRQWLARMQIRYTQGHWRFLFYRD